MWAFLVCQALGIIIHDIYGVRGVGYAEIVNRFFISPAGRASNVVEAMSPRSDYPDRFRNYMQRSDATTFPYPTSLDILRHVVLRSYQLLPLKTRSQQGSKVHPVRNWGHENLCFVSHCHECIAVYAAGNSGHGPLDIYYRY
jgi:hypothetical protein